MCQSKVCLLQMQFDDAHSWEQNWTGGKQGNSIRIYLEAEKCRLCIIYKVLSLFLTLLSWTLMFRSYPWFFSITGCGISFKVWRKIFFFRLNLRQPNFGQNLIQSPCGLSGGQNLPIGRILNRLDLFMNYLEFQFDSMYTGRNWWYL